MRTTLSTVPTHYYDRGHAERAAALLQRGDEDGWSYVVEQLPSGLYQIAIYDEDGAFVAVWGS